jgi:peptidyl-prolyl cis-trans isomerase SurA
VHPPRRRPLVLGTALVAAVLGLSGCRTSPTVAAYVGDSTVTVDELRSAVQQRLADPAVAQAAGGREDQLTRGVLGLLVDEEVHTAAARRYGVQVPDSEVQGRLDQLTASEGADAFYAREAAQGFTRADVATLVREQVLRERLAQAAGQAPGLSEQALRQAYQEALPTLTQTTLGVITVPDQATADGVLRRLTQDPNSYATLAGQYVGQNTLPQPQQVAVGQLNPQLADGVQRTKPGAGYTQTLEGIDGVLVVFVTAVTTPTFEQARPQLEQQAAGSADTAGQSVVDGVRQDLHVTVNPRYGTLQENRIVPATGGQVDILTDDGTGSAASSGAAAGAAQPTG